MADDNKPQKILIRSGFREQKRALVANELARLTDVRTLAVGDDSANPAEIPTNKTIGEFDMSSIDTIKFNNLDLIGKLNGVDIAKIIGRIDTDYDYDTNIFYRQLPSGVNFVVKSASIVDPPGSPGAKDVYLVPLNATGPWTNQQNKFAQKVGTEWKFSDPVPTQVIGVADTGAYLKYTNNGFVSWFPSTDEQLDTSINDRPATPAGVYKLIQQAIGSGEDTEFQNSKFTVSDTPPQDPNVKDFWWDSINQVLLIWVYDGANYSWYSLGGVGGDSVNSNNSAEYALPLTWNYGTERFSFETWTPNPAYNWRDYSFNNVISADAGDDSIDLESTSGVEIGNTYCLIDANGVFIQSVDVIAVLNDNRIRVRNDLSTNIREDDNVTFARSSFDIRTRYANVKDKDRLFTRIISNIPSDSKGTLILRRSATGNGIFTIYNKIVGDIGFTQLDLLKVVPEGDYRDEYYELPRGGRMQFDIRFTAPAGTTDSIFHITTLPRSQNVDANRVLKPVNQTPADQATGVTTTPTLIGSPYKSIYGLVQNGAEFQIAQDKKFTNLVVSSSTDFLASWLRVTGQTAAFKNLLFVDSQTVLTIGDAGSQRISRDGGNTFTPNTLASSFDGKGIAYNGARVLVVGSGGNIQTSDNLGSTWNLGTAGNGYTGTFNGCTLVGSIAVAVGTGGEIQQSVNGGVIWTHINSDNAYTGTFNSVATDPSGNFLIAVGANGEIQTSSNKGANFFRRSNSNNYTGTFYGVSMDANGNAITVGSNGEIQVSSDYGATWLKIPAVGGYTGTFYDVDMDANGNAVAVGSNGEIHSSKDFGRTWQHRIAASGETGIFRAVALTSSNYALIIGDGGIVQKANKLVASTSYSVPPGSDFLAANRVYYWRHRYQDSAGFWSEYSEPTVFAVTQTNFNSVKQAQNISPANNSSSTAPTPTLQSSPFGTISGSDTHQASRWQVSTDPNFATIAYDSGESTTNLLSIKIPNNNILTNNTKYYWRVAHKGLAYGYGPFSSATSFTVVLKSNVPTIVAPIDEALVDPDNLTVNTTAYSSAISGDVLEKTEYQFSKTANFLNATSVVFSSRGGLIDRKTLEYSTTYFIRARQKGTLANDYSSWSPIIQITTTNSISVGEFILNSTEGSVVSWIVPQGVFSVCVVCIGGGGAPYLYTDGQGRASSIGGGGGGLSWKNNINVKPGQKITITAGRAGTVTNRTGGTSSFSTLVSATGGSSNATGGIGGQGGAVLGGDGGGNGGNTYPSGSNTSFRHSGGGGAGGYTGNGGNGGYFASTSTIIPATAGQGGGGGGGALIGPSQSSGSVYTGYRGGGVNTNGIGDSGRAGDNSSLSGAVFSPPGGHGSRGQDNRQNVANTDFDVNFSGGLFGGGGAGPATKSILDGVEGGRGAVRVIWGRGRSYPNNYNS